jgi:nucleoside phosphorylase
MENAAAAGTGGTNENLTNESYTVGWISAINTEYVAAQLFLDEKHPKPEPSSLPIDDNNHYTLGKIGHHNVVVAQLPEGRYGSVSAANVAKDMKRSFPNVRIGLMVGIGGGAPSWRHDVRLGDVVVSSAGPGSSGVFQYDFGKTIQNRSFQATGFLNDPPTFLQTAIGGLKAQYEIQGHQIEQSISEILDKNPRLQAKYKRPHSSTDKLYRSDVIHSDADCCETATMDETSKLRSRQPRAAHEDDPAIHYGLIASANQVLKDASIRDKLSEEKDVMCFEMEAAGLMKDFPCLVIRGICDYADTHKSKQWQGYAAMAAAAYTKDLLSEIRPNQVEAQKKIIEMGMSKLIVMFSLHL